MRILVPAADRGRGESSGRWYSLPSSMTGSDMKTVTLTACALALSSFTLVEMTASADARARHSRGMTAKSAPKSGPNNTGGLNASSSAVGGNAAQPSRPGTQGSGGGSGNSGQ